MAYDLIGALPAGTTPVWLRAMVTREGSDVVTRCCVIAEGQVMPIEVRVNVPQLAATLRAMGMVPPGGDSVAGFGSFLKNAVKSVTKNKIVKAVGKAVTSVAKSPIVQVMNPAAAIAVHTSSKALGGKGVIKGALGKLVDAGSAAAAPVAAPAALGFVTPRAAAALGLGLKTVQTARLGSTIASVAKVAQQNVNLGKAAAAAMKAGKVDPKKALPLVQNAVKLRANVQKLAPKLAGQVVASSKVKNAIASIAQKAKAGSADAMQAATVIAKSAAALDKILMLQAQSAGGLPGLLVTADGRVVKAPRGRFQLRTATTSRPDILYRGAKDPQLKGLFAAVSGWDQSLVPSPWSLDPGQRPETRPLETISGPEWGGHDDPGDEMEGPLYPVTPEGGGWKLDDLGVGALTP